MSTKAAKDMNNILRKNAPRLMAIANKERNLRVVREAIEAGIGSYTYKRMVMDRFPEYYVEEGAEERLSNVWNTRMIDFEILDQIETVTQEFKQS